MIKHETSNKIFKVSDWLKMNLKFYETGGFLACKIFSLHSYITHFELIFFSQTSVTFTGPLKFQMTKKFPFI